MQTNLWVSVLTIGRPLHARFCRINAFSFCILFESGVPLFGESWTLTIRGLLETLDPNSWVFLWSVNPGAWLSLSYQSLCFCFRRPRTKRWWIFVTQERSVKDTLEPLPGAGELASSHLISEQAVGSWGGKIVWQNLLIFPGMYFYVCIIYIWWTDESTFHLPTIYRVEDVVCEAWTRYHIPPCGNTWSRSLLLGWDPF